MNAASLMPDHRLEIAPESLAHFYSPHRSRSPDLSSISATRRAETGEAMAKRKPSTPANRSEAPLSGDVEPAYSYADLERRGEGSRWTIDRRVRDGTYPLPDYFVGPYPRWLASTIRRHREALIAATRGPNGRQ